MPSLIRFLVIVLTLVGIVCGGLFAAAITLEPETKLIETPIRNVKPKA